MSARGAPAGPIVALAGATMGTSWSVRYAGGHGRAVDMVQAALVTRLAALVGDLSHWEAESALSRFNRAPAGQWMALPADLAAVIAAGIAMARTSGGAFDPAIGAIVNLWGYGPPGPQPRPDDAMLAEVRRRGGHARLDHDAPGSRLRQPGGLALDLSGIAKGHAVDALGEVLDAAGIDDWLVEIGGELKGRGLRPDWAPWWVDLEDVPGAPLPPLRIALHGLAVATSGDYRKGTHTIDPRTARPATGGIRAVSVLHASAMWADAWATALTVLGDEAGPALAETHGIAARFVCSDGAERLTPALAAMLAD